MSNTNKEYEEYEEYGVFLNKRIQKICDFQIKLHKLAIKYNYKEIVKTLKENNLKHYFKLLLELNQHPSGIFSVYEKRECDLCGKVDFYAYNGEKKIYFCIRCWDKNIQS